ncbi:MULTISPECIES: DUF4870 domain-containing protein [Sporosarcina]|uniref:DUF4870 domain-containing protein n=1 Tax=Sporosarcina TaxID=1569 RepID=UPI00058F18F6|nr:MULTISPECIES: DUF4870 domain-containing protein [Sporosarcina]WJY27637.1 DUF4870 domain-containing protein [Sporosarcina sp. 0.2-SM1T-5]
MTSAKALSSLSYFSIFFAPLLVPLIVWFAVEDRDVKHHSKRAFISHLIPAFLIAAASVFSFFRLLTMKTRTEQLLTDPGAAGMLESYSYMGAAPLLIMLAYGFLFLIVLIWNIVQGIKVFKL